MGVSEATAWCQNVWRMLNDGGTWAVPRSGLIYRKDAAASQLVLISRMPWDHVMHDHITEEQLREQQDDDHRTNVEVFGMAGIEVIDAT